MYLHGQLSLSIKSSEEQNGKKETYSEPVPVPVPLPPLGAGAGAGLDPAPASKAAVIKLVPRVIVPESRG